MRALSEKRPDLAGAPVARIRRLMEAYVGDATVTGYEHLIPTLSLPDPDDRHVLAAAIQGGASVIVTSNLVDFPAVALAPHGITALTPDAFVLGLLAADAETVTTALTAGRADLVNPPLSVEQYLDGLARGGLPQAAAAFLALADKL